MNQDAINAARALCVDAIDDLTIRAFSLLFPAVGELEEARDVVDSLAQKAPFEISDTGVIGGYEHRRLRMLVSSSEGRFVRAWVMAFGPMDELPPTRQAPYFELAIRTQEKPAEIFHRLNQDRELAHLADIPLQMPEMWWEQRWASTLARTRRMLGGEPDARSAAKSTLSWPVDSEGQGADLDAGSGDYA